MQSGQIGTKWFIAVLLVVVGGLTLGPALMLVVGSFSQGLGAVGTFTLEKYARVYSDARLPQVVLNTVIYSFGSAFLATTLAVILAYLNFRTDIPFRGVLHLLPVVSMMIPHLAYGSSWALLLNPTNGMLNLILQEFGLGPINIYSLPGMIFVEGLLDLPVAYLVIVAAMASFDSSLEEASWVSGRSRAATWWRIILPILRPAILAAITLVLIRSISAFAIPSVLGMPGRIEVLTTFIYRLINVGFVPDYGRAAAVGVSVLGAAVVLVYLYRYLTARSERFVTISGKGYRPTISRLGVWRWPLGLFVLLLGILLVVLPVLVLLYTSLVPYVMAPSAEAFRQLTWRNWTQVLGDPLTLRALRNSIILALGGATLGIILSTLTSYVVVRVRTRSSAVLEALTFLSFSFPGLVIGVGFMWLFARTDLYGTLWALLIGYVAVYLPYGIRPLTSTFIQISKDLEDASAVSGAGFFRTFRKVVAPLALPGVLSGWTLLLVMFVRELDVSTVLARPGSEVLSVQLYRAVADALWGRVAALGLIMVAISTTLVLIANGLASRFSRMGKAG
ncbi:MULTISPECIES: ABC transporter permease [Limnochorda]|uniref:ABC transporter permease n=1 Tax=Limnochorda TaxID=1676651 RepID=UPI0017E14F76|nr:iron ABC transporter permease [Limnochorda pilosa]MBO2486279.1 ABC transporter permease [Bacillota bacterium]MBO2519910.1 ABC transporter permease [Bacillota bacterium]NMA71568.1 iron ABC transporter permease [Bacillota bacterium]